MVEVVWFHQVLLIVLALAKDGSTNATASEVTAHVISNLHATHQEGNYQRFKRHKQHQELHNPQHRGLDHEHDSGAQSHEMVSPERRHRETPLMRRSMEANVHPEIVHDPLLRKWHEDSQMGVSSPAAPGQIDTRAFQYEKGAGVESAQSRGNCTRLMVGTWWFHGGSAFREFRLIREGDDQFFFRQAWSTWPYVREGPLQQLSSEMARFTMSGRLSTVCAFQGSLSDGDQIHVYYHYANSRTPETIEVASAHNLQHSVLASRPPAPWLSPNSAALLIAGALLLTSMLTDRCCSCRSSIKHYKSETNDAGSQRSSPATSAGAEYRTPEEVRKMAHNADASVQSEKPLQSMQEPRKLPEPVREEWLDSLRLTCIAFMVIRHALQSLERLKRLPRQAMHISENMVVEAGGNMRERQVAFFLHGLPIFLYIAGRSCGTSLPPQGSSVVDLFRYLRRRAVRLLLPDLLGAMPVIVLTEYIGRDWRPCAVNNKHSNWIWSYLFNTNSDYGLHCEGLSWLGFLMTLFCVQAMVYPWAAALHWQLLLRTNQVRATWALSIGCLCFPMLWLAVCLSCIGAATLNLGSDMQLPLRSVFRPDVALVCAPFLADMLMIQVAPAGAAVQLPGWRSYFWSAAVFRRIVASVALATFTLHMDFDRSNSSPTLWIELLCFTIFYQQGVMDGLLRTASACELAEGIKEGTKTHCTEEMWKNIWKLLAPVNTMLQSVCTTKIHDLVMAATCWGLWLLLSLIPVPGMMIAGPGSRYPAYRRASAGHFIMRSWAVLGLAIWWWSRHLPACFKRMSGFAELGFSFYFLHWLFIEFTLLVIYGKPAPEGETLPEGELPWWAALFVSLFVCCIGVLLCHALLLLLIRGGLKQAIKTSN